MWTNQIRDTIPDVACLTGPGNIPAPDFNAAVNTIIVIVLIAALIHCVCVLITALIMDRIVHQAFDETGTKQESEDIAGYLVLTALIATQWWIFVPTIVEWARTPKNVTKEEL